MPSTESHSRTPVFQSYKVLLPSFLACAAVLLVCMLGTLYLYDIFVDGEPGPIERSQNIILLVCLMLAVRRALSARGLERGWMAVVAAGLFLLLGEEISWGQWLFDWSSPAWFQANNHQQETNLHNMSWGLNILPRYLLRLVIAVAGIYPLIRPRLGRELLDLPDWLTPKMLSVMPALFMLGTAVFNLTPLRVSAELNYFEVSEMEEVFIYLFFLTYLIAIPRPGAHPVKG